MKTHIWYYSYRWLEYWFFSKNFQKVIKYFTRYLSLSNWILLQQDGCQRLRSSNLQLLAYQWAHSLSLNLILIKNDLLPVDNVSWRLFNVLNGNNLVFRIHKVYMKISNTQYKYRSVIFFENLCKWKLL